MCSGKKWLTQGYWRLECGYGRSFFPALSCSNHTSSKDWLSSSTPGLPHPLSHPQPQSFQGIFSSNCWAHHLPAIHHNLKNLSSEGAAQAPDGQLQPPNLASQTEVRCLQHPGWAKTGQRRLELGNHQHLPKMSTNRYLSWLCLYKSLWKIV